MSKIVDERVVSMQFDNRQFESNVQTSLGTLAKLKQSLNLSGASKGLEDINSAARRFDMSGLSGAVDTVHAKFSALQVIGTTALANITNSAVNAGKRIVSALSLDSIRDGFAEYETQMNAVQTILANTQSKGTTLDQVNDALNTLNTYADKTIYNFTEMTRNIGTFTAAGVDLQTSVDSIQGIANLAAVSGSTSQQASTAMYQLSQAIATGTVKLMDWNSVVNAGMGGQVFQDALIRTSEHLQTGAKAAIKAKGSFRESLSEGWLTTQVLTETLKQFSLSVDTAEDYNNAIQQLVSSGYTQEEAKAIADMAKTAGDAATKVKTFSQLIDTLKEALGSGWTQTWQIIIGDFEEAKALWTEVSDVLSQAINDSAQARNDLLQGWSDLGGRTALIDSFRNAFEGIVSVIKPIKEAFNEIFPPATAQQLFNLTEGLKNFTAKLKLSDEASANLKSTFKGLFAVLHIVSQAFLAVVKGVASLFGGVGNLAGKILSVTGSFGEWLVKLDESITKSDIFNEVVQKVVDTIKNLVNGIKNFAQIAVSEVKDFAQTIGDKLNFHPLELLQNVLENIRNRFGEVTDAVSKFGDSLAGSKILNAVQSLWNGVKKIGSAVASGLGTIMKGLVDGIGGAKFNGFLDLLNTASFGGIAVAITKFVRSVKEPLESLGGLKDILDGVTGILDGVKDCLKAYQEQLKAGTLLKIAAAIGILATSLLIISSIDSGKLSTSLGAITVLFADLMASMAVFDKLDSSGLKGASKSIGLMIGISISVLILASALKKLGSLDTDTLGKGILGVTVLMGELIGAMKLMATDSDKTVKGMTQMVVLAVALKVLASACEDLSQLSVKELAKGLIGIGVILGEFVGFQALMQLIDTSGMLKSALSLVVIGAAMEIFANVCSKFADSNWETMGKAAAALTVVLGEFVGFQALMQLIDTSGMLKSVLSLIAVGAAMEIFANVCSKFGDTGWETMGKAAAALTVVLGEFVGFQALMQHIDTKGMVKSVLSLIAVGAAMEIFADVCSKLGNMDWESLGKAAASLTVVLGEFVGFQALMQHIDTKGMVKSVLSLIAVGAAMEIFANVCAKLGGMDWGQLAKAGAAMAGILLLATGFAALAGMTSGIIKSAAALLIMAVALRIFTPVLTALGEMSLGSIVKGLLALGGAFVVLGAAGLLLEPLVPAIIALAAALALIGIGVAATGAGVLMLATGITALATALTTGATAIAAGLAVIITGIANLIPMIAMKIGEAIVAICNVIAESAPAIGEAVKAVVLTLVDVLVECVPAIVEGAYALITQLLDKLVEYGPQIVDKLITFVIQILDTLTQRAPEFVDSLVNFILAAINALSARMPELIEAGVSLVSSIIQGIVNSLGPIIQNVIQPLVGIVLQLISGIAEALSTVISSVTSLVQQLGNSISQVFMSIAAVISTAGASISMVLMSIAGVFNTVFTGISTVVMSVGTSISMVLMSIAGVISTVFIGIANVITSVGNSISQVLTSIADTISSVFTGISDVITSIGDSIRNVLDGIADIISSIGDAALNAGNGFKSLAEGVQIITNLNIVDMATSMAAVALALGDIASKSSGLAEAGAGMQQIASGTQMSAAAFNAMAMGITTITSMLSAIGPTASAAMSVLVSSVTSSASCFTSMSTAASSAVASVIASLSSIGLGVAVFSSSISGLTGAMSSVMSSMVSVVTGASARISSAVRAMMTSFARTIASQGASAASAFGVVITRMMAMVLSRAGQFRSSGMMLMMNFKMGLRSGLNGVTSAIDSALSSCVGAIRSHQASFAGAGKDLGQGLVSGINSKKQAAYDAGFALGQKAVQGEKDGQKSNSPSKLTIKSGKWLGEGLVIGMDRMGKTVYKAGKSMGSGAVGGISKALDNTKNLISNISDVTPTISPVVDMSNAKYQMPELQLGANIGSLVSQPVNSLGSIVSRAQADINASNMEVVTAVNALRDDLNSMYESDDQEIALYVDGKKLASSIAKPMNRQLNLISKREGGL